MRQNIINYLMERALNHIVISNKNYFKKYENFVWFQAYLCFILNQSAQ